VKKKPSKDKPSIDLAPPIENIIAPDGRRKEEEKEEKKMRRRWWRWWGAAHAAKVEARRALSAATTSVKIVGILLFMLDRKY